MTHWELAVTGPAQRDLSRLPPRAAAAVATFLTGPLLDNPERLSKPLQADLDGYRSARRGDYRVLLTISSPPPTVTVHRIAHRAHAYRPGMKPSDG